MVPVFCRVLALADALNFIPAAEFARSIDRSRIESASAACVYA
jgi:hypothetical protein